MAEAHMAEAHALQSLRRLLTDEEQLNKLLPKDHKTNADLRSEMLRQQDVVLLMLLRARKLDVPRTIPLMANYLHAHHTDPWFAPFPAVRAARLLEQFPMTILPTRDNHGCAVFAITDVSRMCEVVTASGNHNELMLAWMWMMRRLLLDEDTQRNGVSVIEDLSGFTIAAAKHMRDNPEYMEMEKKKAHLAKETWPIRYRRVMILDAPWYIDWIWKVSKMFLTAKMRERIHFFNRNQLGEIKADFTPSSLPVEFGGTLKYNFGEWLLAQVQDEDPDTKYVPGGIYATMPTSSTDPSFTPYPKCKSVEVETF
eukprot:TRINITY_DN9857_c0_g1_i1.p1 TRINITY_DN9857_c0_g1~~TRINITY_DN9857_c0_g1_i1.p1  ORF type:complete len:311 (-),score=59.11 TRINITY_DN9857_c0_g1_i1:131-1063(-)